MTVLALTLAGPLQAWGSSSRFTTRSTDDAPTKSGIVGLLAAAKGLRRTDSLEEFLGLRLAVRIDQPGELVRDFQTARSLDERRVMPLSYRFYRGDARYLVGVEADPSLLEGFADALRRPAFPLYLGRRSCPPSLPLAPTLRDGDLEDLLLDEPWVAAPWWRRRRPDGDARVEFRVDTGVSDDFRTRYVQGEDVVRDEPLSFDPELRQYDWRTVLRGWLPIAGADAPPSTPPAHDPFLAVS